jgi:hypothetical protein
MDYTTTSPFDLTNSLRIDTIVSSIETTLAKLHSEKEPRNYIKHDAKRGHYLALQIPDCQINPLEQAHIRKIYKGSGWNDIQIMLGVPGIYEVYLFLPQ